MVFSNRVDRHTEYFGLTKLFSFGNGIYLTYSNMNDYHITHSTMCKNGLKYITKSCTISLSLYGSTKGVTRNPQGWWI